MENILVKYVGEKPEWKRFTLIMSAVSIGNIGQLAVDLLIATLKAEKVCLIFHEAILPIVGADAYEEISDEITTACEAFVCNDHKLVFLQFRSRLIRRYRRKFLEDFVIWCKNEEFQKITLLTSCHAYERLDVHIAGDSFRYFSTTNEHVKESLGWKFIERKFFTLEMAKEKKVFLPGSGFSKHLTEECVKNNVPFWVLLRFAAEGDNIPDALMLVDKLNEWLEIFPKEQGKVLWKIPSSWSKFYGKSPPQEIF